MNNLKFRAWDKIAKKMSEVTAIDFSTKPFRVFYKAYGNENYFNQDAILMQSTGLSDKNGKEIFEGDIVNCGYLFTGSPFEEEDAYEEEKGVVQFLNCGFNIKFKNDTNLFIDIMESCEDIEVIGNIYKNEELLRK